jgi:hypothetical protein
MKNFVTVARYTYPSEYAVLELLLQREEIKYVFLNETVINVLPFHSNAFGGIRLQVHKNDIQKVMDLINELDNDSPLHVVK